MNLTKKYRRRSHSISLLHAHIVFATKYRRRVISEAVFYALRKSMRTAAAKLGVEIIAIEPDGDHIHLLVIYPPAVSVSKMMQSLKGASSRAVRLRGFPEVLKKLWGKAFWSPSYFIVSCGGAPLEIVKSYVEQQQIKSASTRRNNSKSNVAHATPNPERKGALHPPTEVRGFGR
jgi:putative transposase